MGQQQSRKLTPTFPTTRTGDASFPTDAKFATVHAFVSNHFKRERSLSSRNLFKLNRTAALNKGRVLCAE